MNFKKKTLAAIMFLSSASLNVFAAEGDSFEWKAFEKNIYYNFLEENGPIDMPTKNVEGDCYNQAAGHKDKDWWTFIYGSGIDQMTYSGGKMITDEAIDNLLTRLNTDFNYITDTMGWPRDARVQNGYRSAVYLYGSMSCTGSDDPTATGGWASSIDGYTCIAASYYPIFCFNPNCTYYDRESQMSAMVHEGIHCVLTGMASHVHWFQESGNTWLQQEMEQRRSGKDPNDSEAYSGMGDLNSVGLIAPFVPIECYSGWLTDGSFGGPGAQGVGSFPNCNWKSQLGGSQYSNLFPTFLGTWISEGAVPWIWMNCNNSSKYILETIADEIGDHLARRLIMEYRAKLTLCDMKGWSNEMRTLMNAHFGNSYGCEADDKNWYGDGWSNCAVDKWKVTPYAVTTNNNGTLTPASWTTPGWSGANEIPLTVTGSTVKVEFEPIGSNMSMQLCYRATDGTPVYSDTVMSAGTVTLRLDKPAQDNIVFAVVCNTDYAYKGETTRTAHYDYRLKLVEGISGAADPYTKWYSNFKLDYDWDAVSHVVTNGKQTEIQRDVIETITFNVNLPIASNYEPTYVTLDATQILGDLQVSETTFSDAIGNTVNLYGLNPSGTFTKQFTANNGYWYNAEGKACGYSTGDPYVYAELNSTTNQISIGHYPDKVNVGETYTIQQAFVTSDKQVNVVFNVTIVEEDAASVSVNKSVSENPLLIYMDGKTMVAQYDVPFDCNVKLSLYTAYGALIGNLVDDYQQQGTYTYGLDMEKANLPMGIYIMKYTFPGNKYSKSIILDARK